MLSRLWASIAVTCSYSSPPFLCALAPTIQWRSQISVITGADGGRDHMLLQGELWPRLWVPGAHLLLKLTKLKIVDKWHWQLYSPWLKIYNNAVVVQVSWPRMIYQDTQKFTWPWAHMGPGVAMPLQLSLCDCAVHFWYLYASQTWC